MDENKVIGIVGGMGPHSGSALFNDILNNTNAKVDQDHFSIILMSYPKFIEDRTAFIEGKVSENPAYSVLEVIKRLYDSGATVIGMACNTVYAPKIYRVIKEELFLRNYDVNLLHMPNEVARCLSENYSHIKKIGILGTNGTYKTEVYKNIFEEMGKEVISPSFEFQSEVINRIIYDPEFGIKASPDDLKLEALKLWNEALDYYKKNGVEAIVLGCTEFSLLFKSIENKDFLFLDSSEILAKALIREVNCTNSVIEIKEKSI